MNRKRQILRRRGDEVARAFSLFGEALFSKNPGAFFDQKGEELERELADRGAIVVEGELVPDEKAKK